MNVYKYYIEEGGSYQFAIEFKSQWKEDDLQWVAEDAAEQGYSENDLWEYTWPLTFVIVDVDNNYLGRFKVELDCQPCFHADKL